MSAVQGAGRFFVPVQTDVLVEGVGLLKDFAVVLEKSKALNQIRILEFATGGATSPFPNRSIRRSRPGNPEYDTHLFTYSYQSLTIHQRSSVSEV